MNKTIAFLLLLAPLAACSDTATEEPVATGGGTPATEAGGTPGDPAPDGMGDMPPVDFEGGEEGRQRQEPRAPRLQPEVPTSDRTPQFAFETDAVADAELGDFFVEMDITIDGEEVGTMTFTFWPEKAPITVRNFYRYVDEGFYDGKIFHRVMRDFMIQGGSSTNTAAGQGPNGNIKGEFSDEKKYNHEYGVLSMARGTSPDSGSSQFFVITERSMSSRGLDGQYASFGRMVHGVAVLEAIANIPTTPNPMSGEDSSPTKRAAIKEARIIRGVPTVSEPIERPKPDLGGEPERIRIQHVLVSFGGKTPTATRTQAEAETLAQEILQRAQAGEDFDALVQEYSDDPGSKDTVPAGSYSLLNKGIRDYASEEASFELQKQAQTLQQELLAEVDAKTLTMDQAREQYMETMKALQAELASVQWWSRGDMVPAFGDVGFTLQVGEVGMAPFDAQSSPFGFHIIKRYE